MTQTTTISEPVQGLTPSRIDPKNMGLAMEFFTTIYSRPRDAVLRELAANGIDAQREVSAVISADNEMASVSAGVDDNVSAHLHVFEADHGEYVQFVLPLRLR